MADFELALWLGLASGLIHGLGSEGVIPKYGNVSDLTLLSKVALVSFVLIIFMLGEDRSTGLYSALIWLGAAKAAQYASQGIVQMFTS